MNVRTSAESARQRLFGTCGSCSTVFREMEYFLRYVAQSCLETYEYPDKLESALENRSRDSTRSTGFDHWFDVYRRAPQSSTMRWCTRKMKIEPSRNGSVMTRLCRTSRSGR